jgi:hypothetical protein
MARRRTRRAQSLGVEDEASWISIQHLSPSDVQSVCTKRLWNRAASVLARSDGTTERSFRDDISPFGTHIDLHLRRSADLAYDCLAV